MGATKPVHDRSTDSHNKDLQQHIGHERDSHRTARDWDIAWYGFQGSEVGAGTYGGVWSEDLVGKGKDECNQSRVECVSLLWAGYERLVLNHSAVFGSASRETVQPYRLLKV